MSTKCSWRRLTGVREQPISNGIHLKLVSPWQTPSFPLLTYYLASNSVSPDISLTSISPLLGWINEVGPTLKSSPPIGSPHWNVIHLNPQLDLPLTSKSAIDCLLRAPNWNHSFPPVDITFDVNPALVRPHKFLLGTSHVFVHKFFNTPSVP